jgi:gamma-glutamyltranspeptidase / glutathione hydrolase
MFKLAYEFVAKRKNQSTSGALALALALIGCMSQPQMSKTEGVPSTTATTVATGRQGMVASDAPLATEVGARILEQGGNAVDAAVAVGFAMAVVYPEAGNIGGGGFIVARFADGKTVALDFREVAPGRATRDMFVDAEGKVTDKSLNGHLASGVPGAVAGLYEMHQKHGSMPWKNLVQPAIDLAQNGFVVDEHLSRAIGNDERLIDFPASAKLLLRNGKAPAPGTRLDNPDIAKTLRRIAERGRDGFYTGETADLIVAEMEKGGGLISHSDLANYKPKWRTPIEFSYRNHKVYSMAPASSGGLTIGITLNILSGYDIKALGPRSPERYHLIAEASRRAFADRNHFLGDPDVVTIPFDMLLSKQYADRQRASISRAHATPSTSVRAGIPVAENIHTTHWSVVDRNGNAVALTTTLNGLHGSGVTVEGAGFLLNNEMDDFTSKVGEPNMFGLVQGEANAIAPGKRMLSAMTPTIVVDPTGKTLLVTGARGGPRIISAVLQIVSNVIDHGMGLPEAVNAPRIHHQHLPDQLYYEREGFDAATVAALAQKGHKMQPLGAVAAAPTVLRVGDVWLGMPDPRSGGLAKGY